MLVGGLDPGLHGACAVVDEGKLVFCGSFVAVEAKTRGKEMLYSQVWTTVASASLFAPEVMYVERVQAMPRQGASSGFKFGITYGAALMACAGNYLPIEPAEPRLWMKFHHLQGRNDDQAIATACRLFPEKAAYFTPVRNSLTKEDAVGRADAALIALWGYRLRTRGGMGSEGNT